MYCKKRCFNFPWLGSSYHVAKSKRNLCFSTGPFRQRYANAKSSIAQENGFHKLIEARLSKTIALDAKNYGPIMNPNAPTRSAQIRRKRKQEEMSTNAGKIFLCGKEMRSLQIQTRNAMYVYPNVMMVSCSMLMTVFIVISQ